MQRLADPTGKILLEVALMDKTGWRLKYLNECGLITDEELERLNVQYGSGAGSNRDSSNQQ